MVWFPHRGAGGRRRRRSGDRGCLKIFCRIRRNRGRFAGRTGGSSRGIRAIRRGGRRGGGTMRRYFRGDVRCGSRNIDPHGDRLALTATPRRCGLCLQRLLAPRRERPVGLRCRRSKMPATSSRDGGGHLGGRRRHAEPRRRLRAVADVNTFLRAIDARDVEERLQQAGGSPMRRAGDSRLRPAGGTLRPARSSRAAAADVDACASR